MPLAAQQTVGISISTCSSNLSVTCEPPSRSGAMHPVQQQQQQNTQLFEHSGP